MNTKTLIHAGLAVALSAGAAMAQAQTVQMTGWAYGSSNEVSFAAPSGLSDTLDAGAFKGVLSGFGAQFDTASFVTYCVDLSQEFTLPSVMTGYSIVSGASDTASFASGGWGANAAATSARLGQLMTYVKAHPTAVDTAAESTALQLAIWNVIYDSDNNVNSGAFDVNYFTNIAYGATANALLTNSLSTVSNLSVYVLKSSTKQDFLVTVSAVPEPSTYAMMALGLAGIGFVARRRTLQQR